VLLDLRAVPFLDSSAIGWLMNTRRELERGGGLIVLHSIQPRVRQVLDLLRVGKALPLVDNEAAALTVIAAAAAGLTVAAASSPTAPKAPRTAKAPTTAKAATPRRRGTKAA
jgi:stage II sporulation protein AA (anti-sigma F factor antagonist)